MNKKILIVEDEVLLGLMLSENITAFGFTVSKVATSGEEAVLSVNAEQPDAILMDIGLGGDLNGIEAAKKIKDNYDIPILFFTGYQDEKLYQQAMEVKPAAILDKLGPTSELKEAMTTLFV